MTDATLYSAAPVRAGGCLAVVADRVSYENATLWRQCRSVRAVGIQVCAVHHAKIDAGHEVRLYRPVEGGFAETDLRSHLTPDALVRASVRRSQAVEARLRLERRDAACAEARACERRNGVRGTLRTLTTAAVAGAATGWSAKRNFWGVDDGAPPLS